MIRVIALSLTALVTVSIPGRAQQTASDSLQFVVALGAAVRDGMRGNIAWSPDDRGRGWFRESFRIAAGAQRMPAYDSIPESARSSGKAIIVFLQSMDLSAPPGTAVVEFQTVPASPDRFYSRSSYRYSRDPNNPCAFRRDLLNQFLLLQERNNTPLTPNGESK